MLKRIITSIVALVCLFVPALLFSQTIVLPVAIALCTLISIYEMLKCMGVEKKYFISVPTYLIAVAAPIVVRYLKNGAALGALAFAVTAIYLVYTFVCIIWSHGKYTFSQGLSVFGISAYIIAAFCGLMYIRDLRHGGTLFLLIFIGAWITDIFAYFTGMLLGKHKLIPDVSPKKTVEGSIGGIVFCILAFHAYALIVDNMFRISIAYWFLLLCGIMIPIIAQIGDLIMSVIKRHFGIKDYGKIFPGHGGMLDRFDSVLIVSLFVLAVIIFAKNFGLTYIYKV